MTGNDENRARLCRRLMIATVVLLGLSLLVETLVDKHPYFPVAGMFGFSVWFGLGVSLAAILLARIWGALFRRTEEFYDD